MPARKVGRAWLGLCAALALHVLDEALTGFLDVYNPTVLAIRNRWPWLRLPVFEFQEWIVGLILAVVALTALSLFVYRGMRWIKYAGYVFAIIMLANAAAHALTSLAKTRPMPGVYSSPLLLLAAIYLLVQLRAWTPQPTH
jgi:multisubunit Na+/H+ antiporter MnhE subunit